MQKARDNFQINSINLISILKQDRAFSHWEMASDESGIHLIKRAIELDTNKRYADALVCYREGIELLMDSIKSYLR
jgi:hypothetical protein